MTHSAIQKYEEAARNIANRLVTSGSAASIADTEEQAHDIVHTALDADIAALTAAAVTLAREVGTEALGATENFEIENDRKPLNLPPLVVRNSLRAAQRQTLERLTTPKGQGEAHG